MEFSKKQVHSHIDEKGEKVYKYIIKGEYMDIIEDLFESDKIKKEKVEEIQPTIIIDMDESAPVVDNNKEEARNKHKEKLRAQIKANQERRQKEKEEQDKKEEQEKKDKEDQENKERIQKEKEQRKHKLKIIIAKNKLKENIIIKNEKLLFNELKKK